MLEWMAERAAGGLLAVLLGAAMALTVPAAAAQAAATAEGTLVGRMSFTKKPPVVALVYFSEDMGLGRDVTIDQNGKQFTARLSVGSPGSQIVFKNSANIAHNIYVDDAALGVKFDLGLARPRSAFSSAHQIDWKTGGVLKVACKVHPRMRTYVANLASRYYAVVSLEGSRDVTFELPDPDPALTKITVWLPRYSPLEIVILPGETKEADLTRKGKPRGRLVISRP